MKDQIGLNLLEAAAIATQKLAKKLRQLRNRGDASEQDLADAKGAVDAVRRIYARAGLPGFDWDSRAAKKERREEGSDDA
jgi:hypothetical protein